MPIVDGKYEVKLSTTFKTPKEGIDAIKKQLEKSKKVRISSIPVPLLKKLGPLLAGKDVIIIMPPGERPSPDLKKMGKISVATAKIYNDYKGTEVCVGSVSFPNIIFNVFWAGNKILEIDTMEYSKCVKCMKGMFETAWHYSKK